GPARGADPVEGNRILRAVERPDREAVALAQPAPGQPGGHAADPGGELVVGERAAGEGVHDRDARAQLARTAENELVNGNVGDGDLRKRALVDHTAIVTVGG